MVSNAGSSAGAAPAPLDEQIAFILDHPAMSDWLKRALATALDRSPTEVLNDLEILNQVLRRRADLVLAGANPAVGTSSTFDRPVDPDV